MQGGAFQWGTDVLEWKTPLSGAPPKHTAGWQLVGFFQYHPATGQPAFFHREYFECVNASLYGSLNCLTYTEPNTLLST